MNSCCWLLVNQMPRANQNLIWSVKLFNCREFFYTIFGDFYHCDLIFVISVNEVETFNES
ncbi:unnamed protein product [Acanthoscelides obtectus]|uniref:Uncharacterized protein n=1 Tax=Acanthoscelides obtectus TaxID=200917 RepID=A0A9P0MDX5_ACAOB|nr:unnamed protein product [Acanthoscelides obtectus]CAK1626671.1 hypothetical protein AOBTE_LOCUS4021 [Acanthoscelides obtectus]